MTAPTSTSHAPTAGTPRLPDFIIIGAMKCATSTLHDQLGANQGFYMSTPKEPYFFSDDPIYAKGIDWYRSLFADAEPTDLCGESTTHYTKLPVHPNSLPRMLEHVPNAKLIYVMRHPIDRLVSQFVHQWSERQITVDINEAIHRHEELIAYSKYCAQLTPFLDTYGPDKILPVFFDHLRTHPDEELARVGRFLNAPITPVWRDDLEQSNVSSARLKKVPVLDMLVDAPGLSHLRKALVPQSVRDRVKGSLQMSERPELNPASLEMLQQTFDQDLDQLGQLLGIELSCATFVERTQNTTHGWANRSTALGGAA